jgi:hypothetical protein
VCNALRLAQTLAKGGVVRDIAAHLGGPADGLSTQERSVA